MLASLVLAAASVVGEKVPDFGAVEWWNSMPLTIGRLKGRAIFVESFRTW